MAANVLRAVLNQLDAGGNGKGEGTARRAGSEPGLLFGAVESLIEALATARTAEL